MNGISLGFVVGLMVAAVIVVCIYKYANKDGKVKTEYDERQKAIRGNAYRYAFYTEIFTQTLILWLLMSKIELPVENYALLFIGIIAGCTVLAGYCIWKDAYWGLNNNHRRYNIIIIVGIILNIFPVAMQAMSGTLIENGKIGMPMLNITVLVMMAVVYIEILIKRAVSKKAEAEEE
ncbi:MAG: hypothetical protein K5985_02255 [Lachnospiraceae bacterium]|nr:hypothetical protein [Lachnospiraceae bacterium]